MSFFKSTVIQGDLWERTRLVRIGAFLSASWKIRTGLWTRLDFLWGRFLFWGGGGIYYFFQSVKKIAFSTFPQQAKLFHLGGGGGGVL